MPLINCEIALQLTCSKKGILVPGTIQFQIIGWGLSKRGGESDR